MKKTYRCSCCNKLKSIHNLSYAKWDSGLIGPLCDIVGICRTCENSMKKIGETGVVQYKLRIEWEMRNETKRNTKY